MAKAITQSVLNQPQKVARIVKAIA